MYRGILWFDFHCPFKLLLMLLFLLSSSTSANATVHTSSTVRHFFTISFHRRWRLALMNTASSWHLRCLVITFWVCVCGVVTCSTWGDNSGSVCDSLQLCYHLHSWWLGRLGDRFPILSSLKRLLSVVVVVVVASGKLALCEFFLHFFLHDHLHRLKQQQLSFSPSVGSSDYRFELLFFFFCPFCAS